MFWHGYHYRFAKRDWPPVDASVKAFSASKKSKGYKATRVNESNAARSGVAIQPVTTRKSIFLLTAFVPRRSPRPAMEPTIACELETGARSCAKK